MRHAPFLVASGVSGMMRVAESVRLRGVAHVTGHLDAAKQRLRTAGGELKAFYFVTGQYDGVAIVELPNDLTAALHTRRAEDHSSALVGGRQR